VKTPTNSKTGFAGWQKGTTRRFRFSNTSSSEAWALLPAGDSPAWGRLTKSQEQEKIIINRPDRSTYPPDKSVLTSAATPRHRVGLITKVRLLVSPLRQE
jgi:hypothetical protein